MQKFMTALTIVCVLGSIGVLSAQQEAKKAIVQPAQPVLIARTYAVKDLPVWSEQGTKFDPSVLIALLKAKVNPGQWNDNNSITPFAEKSKLVVVTTQNAHEAIADTLAQLRKN